MLENNHVIVTKKRYSGLKILLIIAMCSIEFFGVMWRHIKPQEYSQFFYVFVGYMMILLLVLGKNKSSKIYLSYEFILGCIIKSVLVNAVMTIFIRAVYEELSWKMILFDMSVLTVMNIISVIFVFVIVNGYTKLKCPDAARILHFYPGFFGKAVENNEDPMEKAIKLIEDYEYVYLHELPLRWRKRLMKHCFEKDKTVFCTVNLSDVILKASGLAQDLDTPVYYCSSYGVNGVSAMLKRMMDFGCSLLALMVLWPVFLIVAIAIKKEDGGSVFYKQTRCTKDMKEFTIYKFRSMREDSEENGAQLAVQDDERLTKVGAIIRKYKIDELPQLINILKGDMSVVGPRPERPEFIAEAIKNTPEFVLRTKVKAGLTGYAQVRGFYNTGFREKLLWDLMYIEEFSVLLDIKIIIMTIFTLFSENMRDEDK